MKHYFKQLVSLICSFTLMASLTTAFAAGKFTDVPDTYWADDEITFVTDKGLFNGTTATTFSPEAQMKRGQLAAVLYRYAGSPKVSGTSSCTTSPGSTERPKWTRRRITPSPTWWA